MNDKQKQEFFERLDCSYYKVSMVNGDIVVKLEKEKRDMLIALIETVIEIEGCYCSTEKIIIILIEQATNKTWQEVKMIYEEVMG